MARLRRTRASVSGFLNVHKPEGVTSHHCVAVVRKIFNTTEVGHAGTLDPMATGVLVMALGRATKFLQYLMSDKAYRGVVRFGVTTSTDDITGDKLTEQPVPWLTEPIVGAHLQRFVGTIDQIPPKVSALKVDGKRSYQLARSNTAFEVKPRRVVIHGIDLVSFLAGTFPEATIDVACGAGTYIRSIARECGEAIELPDGVVAADDGVRNQHGRPCVGGTLVSLVRTRSGAYDITDSLTFEQVREHMENGMTPLHSIESGVLHLPAVQLSPVDVERWLKGGEVQVRPHDVAVGLESPNRAPLEHDMALRVYDSSRVFLGVSQVDKTAPYGRFILRRRSFAAE